MIERAELKLRMDAAVIQQGRLADKAKTMTKEDAIQAIRYGADKIFKVRASASRGVRSPKACVDSGLGPPGVRRLGARLLGAGAR